MNKLASLIIAGLLGGLICAVCATILITRPIDPAWLGVLSATLIGVFALLIMNKQVSISAEQSVISQRQIDLAETERRQRALDRLRSDTLAAGMLCTRIGLALDRIRESGDLFACEEAALTLRALIDEPSLIWSGLELLAGLERFADDAKAAIRSEVHWPHFQSANNALALSLGGQLIDANLEYCAGLEDSTEGIVGLPINRRHRERLAEHRRTHPAI